MSRSIETRAGAGAAALQAPSTESLPLCVDLDGTLIRTDTLVESLVHAVHAGSVMMGVPRALAGGRTALKTFLAERVQPDATLLPYNEELLAWLREQRGRGRHLVLVTAAHERIARAVNAHLALFDEVLATSGATNLKGAAKAAVLVERFGERGFVYAGDAGVDLAVWSHAGAAVLVGVRPRVSSAARALVPIEREFDGGRGLLAGIARAVRPHQWLKNLLVFVPAFAAGAFGDLEAWVRALMAFAAFSLTASLVYVVNDLSDLDADRRHPRKRQRPFASGRVPLVLAPLVLGGLLLLAVPMAIASGTALVLLAYAVVSLSYSLKLKEMALVDVFCLAGLYTLRLVAGGVSSGHPVSLWLLAFSVFLFVSLGVVKRVTELLAGVELGRESVARRGYGVGDLRFLESLGISAGLVSALVLALYVQSDVVASRFAQPFWLWALVVLDLYWISNVWLITLRGGMHDDPIVFAAKDRRTLFLAAVGVACMLLAA